MTARELLAFLEAIDEADLEREVFSMDGEIGPTWAGPPRLAVVRRWNSDCDWSEVGRHDDDVPGERVRVVLLDWVI